MKLADCLNSTTLFTRAERGEILREFRAARQVGANVDQQIVAEGVVRARLDAAISEREAVRSEIMGGEPAAPDAMPEPAAPEVPAKMTAAERRAETERKRRDAKITRSEAAKKAVQTRVANAGALDIVQTIARAGGIKDAGGDLRAIMGRPNFMVPTYGALRNEKGMDPDRAREMLVEAGFLPEGATLTDFYAAIDQTVRGRPVFSSRDVNAEIDKAQERRQRRAGEAPADGVAAPAAVYASTWGRALDAPMSSSAATSHEARVGDPRTVQDFKAAWNSGHTHDERLRNIRAELLAKGARTRWEFLALSGATPGVVQGYTSGYPSAVTFTDEALSDLRADGAINLIGQHNHPSGRSLSQQDVQILASFPRVEVIFAHGHNGADYAAALVPQFRKFLLGIPEDERVPLSRWIVQVSHSFDGHITHRIREMIASGAVSVDEANAAHIDIRMVALARAGLIEYAGTASERTTAAIPTWRDMLSEMFTPSRGMQTPAQALILAARRDDRFEGGGGRYDRLAQSLVAHGEDALARHDRHSRALLDGRGVESLTGRVQQAPAVTRAEGSDGRRPEVSQRGGFDLAAQRNDADQRRLGLPQSAKPSERDQGRASAATTEGPRFDPGQKQGRLLDPAAERIDVAKGSISDQQLVIPGAERVAAEGKKPAPAPQRSVVETPLFGGKQAATAEVKAGDRKREAGRQGTLLQVGDSARFRVAGQIDAANSLTPQDQRRRDAVLRAVTTTVRRMAGAASPKAVTADMMRVDGQELWGAYSAADHLLAVSARSPDPIGTVRHETAHILRQLGLIDDAAWSALQEAADSGGWVAKHEITDRWGDQLTRDQAIEEAIAEEFGVGLREGVWKTGSVTADSVFQRIAEFFRRVRVEIKRALSALGARDMSDADVAEAVFSLIERGAFRDDARSAIDRREEIALAGSEDDVVFQMAEAGASPAAATPAPKKARTLRAAIAALRPGSTDPLAKVRVPNDIGWARKTTVTPRTIAAYFPGFADAFFAGTRQFRARDKSISELTEIARPYLDLDQASKEKVGKVVEHGRMAGEVYAPAPDGTISVKNNVGQQIKGKIGGVTLMKDGETVRLTPDEARAYIAYRRVMDVALDKFRDQVVREWGFDPADAAAPKTESAVEDMIEAEQNAGERARLKTLAQVLSSIQQAKKRGYVPFTRYGSHYVSVTTMQDGRSYVVHREHIEPGITSSPNALGPLKRLTIPRLEEKAAALRARLAQIYPPDQGFEISELREVTPDNVGDLPNFSDLDAIIAAANLPADQAAAVQQAIGEVIQKRGFRAHFIKSRNIPGYSVDFERSLADYIVGISGYLARREHLPDIETAIASIPATQPELRKYAKDWNDYIQNPSEEFQGLRQAGFLWYLSGRFSSALVNLSQIPMVTQPYLSMFAGHAATAAAITRAYKDAALAIRPKTKSAGGAGLDVFSPDALPDDVRDVVKAALADGTLMPIETFQEMARARGRTPQSRSIGAKAQATQDAMAFMFQAAERTNRLVSFIAAYRLAQRPGVMERVNADLRDNPLWTRRRKDRRMDAAEFASFVVEETQFVLGKVNRTRMMRGPGALIFQFKSFSANYLELMARLGAFGGGVHRGGHRYAALASMMFAMFLVGGLMGLPGAEDGFDMIEALIKAATGIDPQFERRLRESAGSLAAMAAGALGASEETQASVSALAGRAAARGLAREAGVDVSQRIGMGRAAPKPTGTEHDDFWYRAIGLAGIPGSWVLRGIDIGLAAGRGDWWQAGIRAAPEAAADLMRARQLSTEGVKTIAKGRQVIMPDERLPDGTVAGGASNVTKRALGFQPTGISRAREQMNAVRRASEAPRDLFADFNLRRANIQAAINRASETLEKAQSDAQRATAEVAIKRETQRLDAVMREIEKYNDSAPDERRYKIANPGFAQQLKVANQGQRATQIKKVPMRARGSIEDIQARY